MKAIVMGAGVIGVTSAYFLAKSGYKVTVLEKNSASSLGCSYANGGQLSYSHIEPLASKSSLSLILKALFKPNSFLSIHKFADKELLKWSFQFLKNCSAKNSEINACKIYAISKKSRKALEEILLNEEGIKFDYEKKGILHFYRDLKMFDSAIKQAEVQQRIGIKLHILNRDECIKKEPTLVKLYDKEKLVGGIFYDDDASGNGMLFVKALERICQEKYGVVFQYNAEIKNIFTNYKKITGVHTTNGVFIADKYVYALGAYGNKLLQGIHIDAKIYPLRGYSISIPADNEFLAPSIGLTDCENKIVYSRIGEIFRAAGTIEIAGLKAEKNKSRVKFIEEKIRSSFSEFGNVNKASSWMGCRPVRPNSIPLICEVKKYQNLYINAGHGHLGWTLSCGSAQILSELVSGKLDEEFRFLEEELI